MDADKHGLKDRNEAPKRDRELSKPLKMPINKPPPTLLSVFICVHPWFSSSFAQVFSLTEEPSVGGHFCLMTTLAGWNSIRP
jgi:hypothetical protein